MNSINSSVAPARSIRVLPLVVLALLVFAATSDAFGQKLKSGLTVSSTKGSFGLTKREMKPLLPAIQTQTEGLMKVFAKYEDRIEDGAVFLSIGSDLWEDLRNLRRKNATPSSGTLNQRQSAALRTVYADMEKETVTMLLDEELNFWGEDLELTEPQMDELYKISMRDIARKQILLGQPASPSFDTKMKAITVETESRIKKVLFPEQIDAWEKLRQKFDADRAGLIA